MTEKIFSHFIISFKHNFHNFHHHLTNSREHKTKQENLTTLISCTKARPNLTCTFSVIFCTGRMSLLYPLNKSRTNLSSSSEHKPASKTINTINGNVQLVEFWIAWDKLRKLKIRTPLRHALHFYRFLSRMSKNISLLLYPNTAFPPRRTSFSSFILSLRKRVLPTHRIAEIRNSRTRRRQKYILGGFVVGLVVVPPERSNAPRAQPPPLSYLYCHHHRSI